MFLSEDGFLVGPKFQLFSTMDQEHANFAVAHEFGHLLDENWSLAMRQDPSVDLLHNAPRPAELDANHTARDLLHLSKNPSGWERYGAGGGD